MPFTPTEASIPMPEASIPMPEASYPMPQSMVWSPMQQSSLVAPVTPHVASASQCFNPLATHKTFRQPTPSKPLITVFIGNIPEKVSHIMMKHILATCGNIASWKSVQGIGFCEYYQSECALLAIKILHDMEVGGKKLVVKVDTKTQKILDHIKLEKKGTDDSEQNQKFEVHCRQSINRIITHHNNKMIRKGKQNENKANIVDGGGFNVESTEDEKKKLIFQEIDKFRENLKKQEENEIKRKKNEEKLKLNGRHTTPGNLDSEENRMINRREEQDKRYKEKEKTNKKPTDEREERDREKNERADKEREKIIAEENRIEKIPKKSRGYFDKNKLKEKEMEEEQLELKNNEAMLKEKELAYQKKLNLWITREKQKKKELSKERANKQLIEEKREKNAKQLKKFLEDYNDDNDDQNYYKGKYLQELLKLREKEIEEDERDRQREKNDIQKNIHNNINLEFAEVLKVREENMYKPKLLIDVAEKSKDKLKRNEMEIEYQKNVEVEQECQKHVLEKALTPSLQQPATSSSVHSQTPLPEFSLISQLTQPIALMNTKDTFNNDDEEPPKSKKRKLNHLDYYNEKKEKERKAVEENKETIRLIIERIPNDKDELFSLHLDWTVIDSKLIKKRIRPWINRKIIEYIGEPEPTLLDFICSKVEAASSPQAIFDDVQMVLDDEAELFVIKLWKLLIFEVEKKKIKFIKLEENGHKKK